MYTVYMLCILYVLLHLNDEWVSVVKERYKTKEKQQKNECLNGNMNAVCLFAISKRLMNTPQHQIIIRNINNLMN